MEYVNPVGLRLDGRPPMEVSSNQPALDFVINFLWRRNLLYGCLLQFQMRQLRADIGLVSRADGLTCEMMGTSSAGISTKPIKTSHLISHHHDVDLISNLHEDVLSHILSRLPTKDVIRTSILSKDWQYKWTFSYNMDIDDLSSPDRRLYARRFANFVDRILRFGKYLKSFRLLFGNVYDLGRVQAWISIASRHSLESLQVRCGVEGIVFPCSLLNSTSLRKLDLRWSCTMSVAEKNIATNLTSLYFTLVKIVNGDLNTTTITFSFPVLETFEVVCCEWLNVKFVEIYAPLLTTFKSDPGNTHLVEDYDYSFVIIAPRLATFTCSFGIPEEYILVGSSVVSANLICNCWRVIDPQLRRNIGLRVGKLLNELTSLEELVLTGFMSELSRLGPPLRPHDKLARLDSICPSHCRELFHILDAAPSLKFLKVNVNTIELGDYDYGVIETVPSCIVSQLEEVKFCGFFCEKHQYNLVKFFLNHGERLKKISLRGFDSDERYQVIAILLEFPKHSPCLIYEC